MRARTAIRTPFILLFTAFSVWVMGMDLALPWHPMWTFGIGGGVADAADTVTFAAPTALREGIRVGDRLVRSDVPPFSRHALMSYVSGPRTMVVRTTTGRTIVLRSFPEPRSLSDNVSDLISIVAMLAFILIAAGLVLLRPMPATWAFYAFAYTFCIFSKTANDSPPLLQIFSAIVLPLAAAVSPVAFVSFAMRFPDVKLGSAQANFERVLLFGAAPLLAVIGWFQVFTYTFTTILESPLLNGLSLVLTYAFYATGVAVLITRYLTADEENRNRLQWVVAAFSLAFVPFLVLLFVWRSLNLVPSPTLINLSLTCQVVAPIALAYTVLKHRLFDVRFFVSRALVYGVMMSVSVAVLALVDWACGKWLAESRFALTAELALALLLGASLTMLHRRIEQVLNGVIFRAQALALQGLRRFAQETDLIADPRRLLSQTYEALETRVECEYVAIYTEDGSSYALATQRVELAPPLLPSDDFAVLRLRRWHEPFECDEPRHSLRGALFLPMTARGALVGFVVCGPKRDRTHYLPDEVETLSLLTHRVGSAFALLTLAASRSVLVQTAPT